MKKLLVLIKYIRHFVNERPTPEQEANDILQFMLLRSSTTHTIAVYNALEIIIEAEMKKQEAEFSKKAKAINSKWGNQYKRPTYEEQLEINKLHVVNPILHNRIPGEN